MTHQRKSGGFVMASGIFLLVILASLGAFLVNISSAYQLGASLDILGERAYQAAYAGMEVARYKTWSQAPNPLVAGANYCPVAGADTWNTTSTLSISFIGTQTLAPFVATIECRRQADTDLGNATNRRTQVYEIRVTACNKPRAVGTEPRCPSGDTTANPNSATLGYVERQLTGLISL